MFYFLFTILWISPSPICGNSTDINSTVINETVHKIAVLNKTIRLDCPALVSNPTVETIIWYYKLNEEIIIASPLRPVDVDIADKKFASGSNGSLIIKNVVYSDAKVYLCKALGPNILYEVSINLLVRGPPFRIYNFKCESLSDSVLKFNWDFNVTLSNLITSVNLTLCKSLITKECNTISLNYPTFSYSFKNLKPYFDYRASIVAINSISVSERVDLQTRTLPGTPAARPFVRKTNVESRNMTLTIQCLDCMDPEKMKGKLKSFMIIYSDEYSKYNLTVPYYNGTDIEVNILNLKPYKNYTFFVSAHNGVKSGPQDSVSCKTKEDLPNPSTFIQVTEQKSNELSIQWDKALDKFGPITGYILELSVSDQHSEEENKLIKHEFDSSILSAVVKELRSRTTYSISLYAKNSVGLSKPIVIMGKTDRENPAEPYIENVERVKQFIRLHIKYPIIDNITKQFGYIICYSYKSEINKEYCQKVSQEWSGNFRCNCHFNESKHLVDIPISIFLSNESEVNITVKLSVNSDICNVYRCKELISSTSIPRRILLHEYVKFSKNVIENSTQYSLIFGLLSGVVLIFIISLVFAILFCGKNGGKYAHYLSQPSVYYSRPTGEYIEICTGQSISKILPLEKTPYPPIPMANLVDHINSHRADDGAGFQAEFEAIESMDTTKWVINAAIQKDNKSKNRYTNIFPYDHSRVILQNPPFGKSDYINASFIDGFKRPHAYIATQGPLTETVADFWQMVWEQNSEIIVMISNFVERGRSKCEIYWSPNKTLNCGNVSVQQIYQKEMAFYTERAFRIRNIRLKKNIKDRTVYHYQYTDWRDFDVPPSSLPVLVFVRATTKHWSESSGPIIVHCSAGVGRTGTYICIESQIRQLDQEHQINVRGFLEHIRQQRMKLVQTESQYTFIHDALYEYYLYPDREIHKLELTAYISKLKEFDASGCMKLDTQFKKCINFEPSDYDYMESKKRYNLVKNRSETIMPIESRRINLSCEPGVEGSNYINASAIQGYWQMKEFIITQHPLDETEQDFWKMVWDENCSLIVLLSNENMHQFWPGPDNNARTFRWFKVHCNSEKTEFSVQYSFLMSSSREDYALDCTMHCLKYWPNSVSECSELLRLLFDINSKKYSGPIVVIDEYGSSRAGIFVAMSSLLHQLRNDDVVNVYFVMKMIHIERPYTFSSSSDLLFIYELLEFVILNQHLYTFFSRSQQDFIPNGITHLPVSQKPVLNNTSSLIHYSTLGTMRSKSSTSTSRRRASSVDSEPYGLPTPSPNRKENFGNRISWNAGETRHIGTPLLTESFGEWPIANCNGHVNGPNTNASFENSHISDLPVAKIVNLSSSTNNSQNPPQSSIYNLTNYGALDNGSNSSAVWCTQK